MADVVTRIERRKRSFFGWVFLLMFIGLNILMLMWIIAGAAANGDRMQGLASDAERAGAAVGTALGVGALLILWVLGDIILGMFVLLTAGRKIVTETRYKNDN